MPPYYLTAKYIAMSKTTKGAVAPKKPTTKSTVSKQVAPKVTTWDEHFENEESSEESISFIHADAVKKKYKNGNISYRIQVTHEGSLTWIGYFKNSIAEVLSVPDENGFVTLLPGVTLGDKTGTFEDPKNLQPAGSADRKFVW